METTLTLLPGISSHKWVYRMSEPKSGLTGFIAIHNNNLGSAVGGTRMFPYASEESALADVMRLSEAMTYKCALAHVPHGGGKAVIIGDPKTQKTKALLKAYASAIKQLKGRFHTGEDVGISESDVQYMLTDCPYFIGKKGLAGDPSPYAALSTYVAIKKSVEMVMHKNSLQGVRVAVKGVGKVGSSLVDLLVNDGAVVTIADVDREAVSQVSGKHPKVTVVSATKIGQSTVDVYAPCAMGNEFTIKNIGKVKAHIICGSANNQLASKEVGIALFDRGVVYIPDYVANAGGLINVVDELERDGYNHARVLKRIGRIEETVSTIITISNSKRLPTNIVSDRLAEVEFHRKRFFSIHLPRPFHF